MLHKDRKCQKTENSFRLTLTLHENDGPCDLFCTQKTFESLFASHGEERVFARGEIIVPGCTIERELILIIDGVAEAHVLNLKMDTKKRQENTQAHALGFVIPDTNYRSYESPRHPVHSILGKGDLIGAVNFFDMCSTAYLVRTPLTVRVLRGSAVIGLHTSHDADISILDPKLSRSNIDSIDLALRLHSEGDSKQNCNTLQHAATHCNSTVGLDYEEISTQRSNISGVSWISSENLFASLPKRYSTKKRKPAQMSSFKFVLDTNDLEIAGVSTTERMEADFYHGVAIALAQQLERASMEYIRITRLVAMTDTDAVFLQHDIREQLLNDCVTAFQLPVTETLVLSCQCRLLTCFYGGSSTSTQDPRMRLIVLSNFIIFDPAVYGNRVERKAMVLRQEQAYTWAPTLSKQRNTTSFKAVLDTREQVDYTLTFSSESICAEARRRINEFCSRADETRARLSRRPFHDPFVLDCIQRVAAEHRLREGEALEEVTTSDSLFLVKGGCVTLRCGKMVYAQVREGGCFGEINFVKGLVSGHSYTAFASSAATVVLELQRAPFRQM